MIEETSSMQKCTHQMATPPKRCEIYLVACTYLPQPIIPFISSLNLSLPFPPSSFCFDRFHITRMKIRGCLRSLAHPPHLSLSFYFYSNYIPIFLYLNSSLCPTLSLLPRSPSSSLSFIWFSLFFSFLSTYISLSLSLTSSSLHLTSSFTHK